MRLSYKYLLDLSKDQIGVLQNSFDFCRKMYNAALEERISYYKKYGISLSYVDQAAELKEVKIEFPAETDLLHSQTLQQVLKRLDNAYTSFFKRVKKNSNKKGFPRFKSKDHFKSICFPQCDLKIGGVKLLDNKKLKVCGIPGEVKVNFHRPFEGRCKQVLIVKQRDKFYIILSCDKIPNNILPKTGKS